MRPDIEALSAFSDWKLLLGDNYQMKVMRLKNLFL